MQVATENNTFYYTPIAVSLLGLGFDLREDDIDVGGPEVVVEQSEVSAQLSELGAVHRRR